MGELYQLLRSGSDRQLKSPQCRIQSLHLVVSVLTAQNIKNYMYFTSFWGKFYCIYIVVLKTNRFSLFILRLLFLFPEFYVLIYSFALLEGWTDHTRFMCTVHCYVGLTNVMPSFFHIPN